MTQRMMDIDSTIEVKKAEIEALKFAAENVAKVKGAETDVKYYQRELRSSTIFGTKKQQPPSQK